MEKSRGVRCYTYLREEFRTVYEEMMPLLKLHYEEIAHWRDIPLDPDVESYEVMAAAGMLHLYTCRADGNLVGYAAYIVKPSLHYRSSKQAYQDVVFMHPAHRKAMLGTKMLILAEKDLRESGVQVIWQHVKVAHDWTKLLERMGYKQVEKILAKRLDK